MAQQHSVKERYLENPDLKKHLIKEIILTGRTLGRGSFGTVFELQHAGTSYAGKQIHDILLGIDIAGVQSIIWKFVDECRLMAEVRHPNIVQFMGICFLEGSEHPVLVMEYLDMSLDYFLQARQGHLPLSLKYQLLRDIARGLLHLHTHDPVIIHRDITSRNILIHKISLQAKIADLGNALMADSKRLMDTLSKMPGTAVYMPPEANGLSTRYDSSLDMFSFGHLALYTITEEFPCDLLPATYCVDLTTEKVHANSEVERRQMYLNTLYQTENLGKNHDICKMIRACLSNNPSKRPKAQQVLELLEDLVCAQEDPYSTMGDACKLDLIQLAQKADVKNGSQISGAHLQPLMQRVYDIKGGLPGVMEIYRKRSGLFHGSQRPMEWKEYVFKIEGQHLKYYKSNKPKRIIGEMNLGKVQSVSITETSDKVKFPFLVKFEIDPAIKAKVAGTTPPSPWTLSAYTAEERVNWMEAIKPGCLVTPYEEVVHAIDKLNPYEEVEFLHSLPAGAISEVENPPPLPSTGPPTSAPLSPTNSSAHLLTVPQPHTPEPPTLQLQPQNKPVLYEVLTIEDELQVPLQSPALPTTRSDPPTVPPPPPPLPSSRRSNRSSTSSDCDEDYEDLQPGDLPTESDSQQFPPPPSLTIPTVPLKPAPSVPSPSIPTSDHHSTSSSDSTGIEEIYEDLDSQVFADQQSTPLPGPPQTPPNEPTQVALLKYQVHELENKYDALLKLLPGGTTPRTVPQLSAAASIPSVQSAPLQWLTTQTHNAPPVDPASRYENIYEDVEHSTKSRTLAYNATAKPPLPKPRKRTITVPVVERKLKDNLHDQAQHSLSSQQNMLVDDTSMYISRPDWAKAATNVSSKNEDIGYTLFIAQSKIQNMTKIGKGQYGQVYKADYTPRDGKKFTVAVKTIKKYQSQKAHDDFLKEMGIMAKFVHPNVIKLYGLVQQESPWIVLEYLENGDLKRFLKKHHRPVRVLVKYMLDVAMGMHYIADKGLVHRDIAARNIVVGSDKGCETCKISDFGLLREIPKDDSIYVSQDGTISVPVRWMAPESLTKREFSTASDVWSYGILLWEMRNPRARPYSQIETNLECATQVIAEGLRLDIPEDYPDTVKRIMTACWQKDASKRPSFLLISSLLTNEVEFQN